MHFGVATIARAATNRGFDVLVVDDATASFDRTYDGESVDAGTIHRTTLAQLDGEFATIITAAEILGEQRRL
ncbi:isochorismatase family protein [Natrarchaeobius halalkaliphilus]|uniref:Isochorismatase family protein n=1 Tax=Natrarchaeobius halalkaliphilus TaxID=1679091 RepID=A0A3N6P1L2_9EURY|nr:isochorismatase family protein [Natrarchaeobius halalkaliphilus]